MEKLSFTPLDLCKTQVLWVWHLKFLRNRAKLTSQGNLKTMSILFIEDGIDLIEDACQIQIYGSSRHSS